MDFAISISFKYVIFYFLGMCLCALKRSFDVSKLIV
jgi:hypothetical protein